VEKFIHIRPPTVTVENSKGKDIDVYPDYSGFTIAYRFLPEDTDGKWIALGMSFSSPMEKEWLREKARGIARSRLNDSPVRLQYEGLEADLTSRYVVSGVRTIVYENPKWKHVDDKVLRPGRFTQRWGAALVGPDGSLLTAYFDCKRTPRGVHPSLCVIPRAPSHWVLRIPAFVRGLLEQ